MKEHFVRTLIKEMEISVAKKIEKAGNLNALTLKQTKVYDLLMEGKRTNDIAEKLSVCATSVSQIKKAIKKKGYVWEVPEEEEKIKQLKEMEVNH